MVGADCADRLYEVSHDLGELGERRPSGLADTRHDYREEIHCTVWSGRTCSFGRLFRAALGSVGGIEHF